VKSLFYFVVSLLLIKEVNSQEIRKLDTIIIYKPFISFFEDHPNVKEIRFWPDLVFNRQEIEVVEKDSTSLKDFNHFNLDDKGQRYFFEKRFSFFAVPASLYKNLVDKKAGFVQISTVIRRDSVFISIEQTYYNDDEIRFMKRELDWGYEKGIHILAKELENYFLKSKIANTDSLVFVKALIGRDSTCSVWEVTRCEDSSYKKALITFFVNSSPWIPANKDGRNIKAFQMLYLRLNPDKSYTIAPKYYR
jgi:hypothetical protein